MKTQILFSLSVSVLLLTGCNTTTCCTPSTSAATTAPAPAAAATAVPTPPPASAVTGNIAGDWDWTCCDGTYHGALKLEQDTANKLTGRLYDENDTTGGAVTGTIDGNKVQLSRTWGENFQQDYTLTLSDDGKKLEGDLAGTRDEAVGSHFEATRK